MTKEQILNAIGSYNLNANEWISLEEYFPLIFLAQDANLYPNDNKERYKFNQSTELLEVVHGTYNNGVFKSNTNETSNYTPDSFISYEMIAGLCRTSFKGPYGSYYRIN